MLNNLNVNSPEMFSNKCLLCNNVVKYGSNISRGLYQFHKEKINFFLNFLMKYLPSITSFYVYAVNFVDLKINFRIASLARLLILEKLTVKYFV